MTDKYNVHTLRRAIPRGGCKQDDVALCGIKPYANKGQSWTNGDLVSKCALINAESLRYDQDREHYEPCQACIEHPDYPLYLLNQEEL